MKKTLIIDKVASKNLKRTDKATRERIINAIMGLLEEPPKGDIKPLKGELYGLYRCRVGNWRVTYKTTEEVINILEISPRGGAY